LLTWKPLDSSAINRIFGTSLRSSDFDLILPARLAQAIARRSTTLSLAKNNYLLLVARRLGAQYDVIVTADNESDLGRRGIQYIHFPKFDPVQPRVDLRWYARSPIVENTVLFSLLGTTYGGDGVSTFALPNLQGRVAIDAGQGTGLTNRVLGETGGSEQQTLTADQLPAHSHTFNVPASTSSATTTNPAGGVPAVSPKKNDEEYAPASATNTAMATAQTSPTGGGQPVSTMPPFTTLNCIIALFGIFPSAN